MSDDNNPFRSPKSEPSKAKEVQSLLRGRSPRLDGMHKGYLAGAVLAVVAAFAGIKKNMEMIQERPMEPGVAIGLFVAPALVLLLSAFLFYKSINHRP